MNRSDEQQATESRLGESSSETEAAIEYSGPDSRDEETAQDEGTHSLSLGEAASDADTADDGLKATDEELTNRTDAEGVIDPAEEEVETLFESLEPGASTDQEGDAEDSPEIEGDGSGNGNGKATEILAPAVLETQNNEEEPQVQAAPAAAESGYFYERRRNPGRRWADNIRRLAVVCATVAGLLLTVAVLRYLSWVLMPFAVAFVLAYLLNPVANAFHQATKRRGLAVALTVIVVLGVGTAFSWHVLPLVGSQFKTFADNLNTTWLNVHRSIAYTRVDRTYMPDSIEQAVIPDTREAATSKARSEVGWREFVAAWQDYIKNADTDKAEAIAKVRENTQKTYLGGIFDNAIVFIRNRPLEGMINAAMQDMLISGPTALASIIIGLTMVGVLIVALVYFVMLLTDFPAYAEVWKSFLPADYHGLVVGLATEFHGAMSQYFVRQAITAILTAALFTMGFTYTGLPLAIPFGAFVGLLSMIPYLQLAGIAPAIMLAAFQALDARVPFTPLLLGVLITFVVVQLVQELIFKPFIVGRGSGFERMGLLLGAFVWPLLLYWPLGIVMAIPFTCLIIAVYRLKARQLEAEAERHAAVETWET